MEKMKWSWLACCWSKVK